MDRSMYVSKYVSQFDIDDGNVLLVNALSGAVDIATRDLLPSLRADPSALPGDTLALLQRRGYLLPSAAEEVRLLEQLGDRAHSLRRGKRPREYIICPTYNCNLACTYCFEGTTTRSPEVMDDDCIDALFAAIDKLMKNESQPPTLQLFGGEPLLPSTKHTVARILHQGRRRGLKTNIVTNGVNVLLFADVINAYADSIISFQITIDGPAEVHDQRRRFPGRANRGTFNQMVAAVDYLVRDGHKVWLRVNTDGHNIHSLPALADLIEGAAWLDTGNFRCGIVPVQTHTGDTTYPYYMREDEVVARVTELFEQRPRIADAISFEYYRLVNRIANALDLGGQEYAGPNFHYCESCMLDYLVFGVDGYIYPCPEAIAQPQFAIGRFDPALEIDEERKALWEDRSALKIPKCRDCEIVSFCAGGCAYAALYTHGDIYEPVCGDAKKVLAEYVKYAVKKKRLAADRPAATPTPQPKSPGDFVDQPPPAPSA